MSTCTRCGAPYSVCAVEADPEATHLEKLRCRERELSNLHSLLRSVTGKLEQALEMLGDDRDGEMVPAATREITAALEALS